jgi:hypothetical protein
MSFGKRNQRVSGPRLCVPRRPGESRQRHASRRQARIDDEWNSTPCELGRGAGRHPSFKIISSPRAAGTDQELAPPLIQMRPAQLRVNLPANTSLPRFPPRKRSFRFSATSRRPAASRPSWSFRQSDRPSEADLRRSGPHARVGWEAAIAHKASGLINRAPMAAAAGMRRGFLRPQARELSREEAALD